MCCRAMFPSPAPRLVAKNLEARQLPRLVFGIMRYAFCITVAFAGFAAAARADCLPPLNPQIERRTQTTRVGDVDFTSGYYRYEVPRYTVNSGGCDESINLSNREWHAEFGPGVKDIVPQNTAERISSGSLQRIEPLPPLAALPPLPSLPALPKLPRLSALPTLAPLPPLPAQPALPPLPPLPR